MLHMMNVQIFLLKLLFIIIILKTIFELKIVSSNNFKYFRQKYYFDCCY